MAFDCSSIMEANGSPFAGRVVLGRFTTPLVDTVAGDGLLFLVVDLANRAESSSEI